MKSLLSLVPPLCKCYNYCTNLKFSIYFLNTTQLFCFAIYLNYVYSYYKFQFCISDCGAWRKKSGYSHSAARNEILRSTGLSGGCRVHKRVHSHSRFYGVIRPNFYMYCTLMTPPTPISLFSDNGERKHWLDHP